MGTSAPSGETRYSWNDDMAPRWNRLLESIQNPNGSILYNEDGTLRPRQQYGWTTNPDGSRTQNPGQQRFTNFGQYGDSTNRLSGGDLGEIQGYQRGMIRQSSSPIGSMNAARSQIESTLGGYNLGEPQYDAQGKQTHGGNPYMGLAPAASNPYIGGNQYRDANTSTDRNAFAGNNPYFRDTMNQGMEDITNQYKNATEPGLRAAAVLNGTLGGGDHLQAQAKNEEALGKTLGNYSSQMMNQQYDRSAGLEDSFLNRDIQNQQFNRGTSSGLRENEINRGFQNFTGGLDRGMQGWEGERNRQMGAIGAGQNEQNLAYGRMSPLLDTMGMRMGQDQRGLDFAYDQWNQDQQHPFAMTDWLTGLFSRAQGGMAPNQSIYQSGASGAMPYVGAGLGLAGLLGGG